MRSHRWRIEIIKPTWKSINEREKQERRKKVSSLHVQLCGTTSTAASIIFSILSILSLNFLSAAWKPSNTLIPASRWSLLWKKVFFLLCSVFSSVTCWWWSRLVALCCVSCEASLKIININFVEHRNLLRKIEEFLMWLRRNSREKSEKKWNTSKRSSNLCKNKRRNKKFYGQQEENEEREPRESELNWIDEIEVRDENGWAVRRA